MYGKMRRPTINDLLTTNRELSNEDDKFAVGVYQAGSGDGRSKTRVTFQVTGQVRAVGRIIIILLPCK